MRIIHLRVRTTQTFLPRMVKIFRQKALNAQFASKERSSSRTLTCLLLFVINSTTSTVLTCLNRYVEIRTTRTSSTGPAIKYRSVSWTPYTLMPSRMIYIVLLTRSTYLLLMIEILRQITSYTFFFTLKRFILRTLTMPSTLIKYFVFITSCTFLSIFIKIRRRFTCNTFRPIHLVRSLFATLATTQGFIKRRPFEAILTFFSSFIPIRVTRTNIAVFTIKVRILLGAKNTLLSHNVKDLASRAIFTLVLLGIKVVRMDTMNASLRVYSL